MGWRSRKQLMEDGATRYYTGPSWDAECEEDPWAIWIDHIASFLKHKLGRSTEEHDWITLARDGIIWNEWADDFVFFFIAELYCGHVALCARTMPVISFSSLLPSYKYKHIYIYIYTHIHI